MSIFFEWTFPVLQNSIASSPSFPCRSGLFVGFIFVPGMTHKNDTTLFTVEGADKSSSAFVAKTQNWSSTGNPRAQCARCGSLIHHEISSTQEWVKVLKSQAPLSVPDTFTAQSPPFFKFPSDRLKNNNTSLWSYIMLFLKRYGSLNS